MSEPTSPSPLDAVLKEALAHHHAGRLQEAQRLYQQILQQAPQHFDALHMMGVLALTAGQPEPAVRLLSQATRIRASSPDAWYNFGLALDGAGKRTDAIAAYEAAIRLHPRHAKAFNNKSKSERESGMTEASLASATSALEIDPDYIEAQLNRSMALLKLGRFAEGLPLYEARWHSRANPARAREIDKPLWKGDVALDSRTILVHGEQGLGDNLQMCRYVPMLAEQGARVIVEISAPLLRIMRTLPGASEVIEHGKAQTGFDLHCPVMSLPLALRTEMHTIPSRVPYLQCPSDLVQTWSDRLGPATKPRIGVMWSGGGDPLMQNRSIALEQFSSLFDSRFEWISLHKDVRESDVKALEACVRSGRLRHFGNEQSDFADAAALCQLCELIISVDTSMAHLAGALARPTWILLPWVADWRWLSGRRDSPWYPTARLFRQPREHDWQSVLQQAGAALPHWL